MNRDMSWGGAEKEGLKDQKSKIPKAF